MRRLRRCMGAFDTCCSYGSLNSTPGFLGYRQNDPWKRTARRRQQRRLSRVYERPFSRWLQSRPPLSECRGRDVARVYETRPRGAATADVDVTLTCSSFTRELQRVFPWSLAYSLWQEQRQRQTSAPSAGSALPSIAVPEDGSVSSESPTVGEGYDWRHVFLCAVSLILHCHRPPPPFQRAL
ncbi:hypothetical protein, conserved [Leishmania tarentolae]|uniref:Uncharacterized protein n=1 Tax=Leishmania tarentolae TaxID=5689 RepID=A0A640K908_LEITA|nr:hypothetical protein, conserved [Leishmania tarentolae]